MLFLPPVSASTSEDTKMQTRPWTSAHTVSQSRNVGVISCKPQALGVMRNLALLEFAWLVPLGAMSACLELSCNASE